MAGLFAITDAKPADEPALAEMMRGLNEAESEFVSNRDLSVEAGLQHIRYLMDCVRAQGGFALVGRRSGSALGFAVGLVETEEGDYVLSAHRRFGFLSDLFVAPAARGSGLGAALLDACETRFRELGLTDMRLSVLAGNNHARRLYERAGFLPYEQILSKPL